MKRHSFLSALRACLMASVVCAAFAVPAFAAPPAVTPEQFAKGVFAQASAPAFNFNVAVNHFVVRGADPIDTFQLYSRTRTQNINIHAVPIRMDYNAATKAWDISGFQIRLVSNGNGQKVLQTHLFRCSVFPPKSGKPQGWSKVTVKTDDGDLIWEDTDPTIFDATVTHQGIITEMP
jgi:hypothetical protein